MLPIGIAILVLSGIGILLYLVSALPKMRKRAYEEQQARYKIEVEQEAKTIADGVNTPQLAKTLEKKLESKERARDRASVNGAAYTR